jgi:hypothetical protein
MVNVAKLLLLLFLASSVPSGCVSSSTPTPMPSPDGSRQLVMDRETVKGDLRIVVDLQDSQGKSLFREVTPLSVAGDKVFSARWEGNSRVVLERREPNGRQAASYEIRSDEQGNWSGGVVTGESAGGSS